MNDSLTFFTPSNIPLDFTRRAAGQGYLLAILLYRVAVDAN